MAWNEPGGGKDNDPWGGNNQGPPDLDEALKKLQEKLNSIFGGGKKSGGSGGGDFHLSAGALGIVAVLAAVVWGLFGFYQVDQQERAVVLRLGVYHETVMPGLRWNPPLMDEVNKINVTKVRGIASRGQMLTEDENIVDVALSVQYTVSDPANFLLKVKSPELSLEHALESSLRHVVGSSRMDQVITEGREQIAIDTQERLQGYLDTYQSGILVAKVNIEDAQAPSQVQDAFDDVTRAKEDRERLKNEAEAYANGIIPEARGAAQRQLEEAQAYKEQVVARSQGEAQRFVDLYDEYRKAPKVTRERLYIDALETMYSDATKVMVDVEGGNNMMYLPLDKLMEKSAVTRQTAGTEPDMRQLTDKVIEQLRRDSQSSRREGR
ncbi:membrane protease subunit HflK [gamma proteobacterium BDW918]|uniref:Protein HflK n=1 Tax=Zhongshania aliphaticivorans TaxID=1470434 RepID=A0A127M2I8_9GAMM|nr:FtsH protease activity modulator HflK [Zhongshania aliphaticivorans]AMO67448.1 HflK protein [Zhongshania aliphaticivorans]EIF42954.1 membrane protease subunit HflK [gamma proteobacterium BDW918]|tara:strand:- start:554 stop:1693 length:1140 start_codon:yes stop_codon:yes gene_type:complete